MKSRFFRIGAAVGGLLGILVSAGMDYLSGDIPGAGGGWTGAVAHDFSVAPNSISAIIISVIAIGVLILVSALLGGLCGIIIERFFNIFTHEQ